MQKLDSKKIDAVIRQLENAAKAAVKALNEMTDSGYKDSDLEKDPFGNLGLLGFILQQARDQAKRDSKYEGMSEDEIAQAQATERETEKEMLQQAVLEKLAARQKKAEPELEAEPTGESEPEENDPPQA